MNRQIPQKVKNDAFPARWIAVAGLLMIVVATALPLLRIGGEAFRYIYCAGALAVVTGRALTRCPSSILRVRRLYRLEVWAGVIFCVGGFFLFYDNAGAMDWMAFTLAGGAIEVYASFMIPRAISSSSGQGKKGSK